MSKFDEFKNLSILYAEDDSVLREITGTTLDLVVDKVYSVSEGIGELIHEFQAL